MSENLLVNGNFETVTISLVNKQFVTLYATDTTSLPGKDLRYNVT